MWFDYQSLFDKTKNVILYINYDIEIKHIDFNCNKLAEKATVIIDNQWKLLKTILSDSIDSICILVRNIYKYDEEQLYSSEDIYFVADICTKNYCYLLAIAASLCDLDDKYGVRTDVVNPINFYPKELSYHNINTICYHVGAKVLLNNIDYIYVPY